MCDNFLGVGVGIGGWVNAMYDIMIWESDYEYDVGRHGNAWYVNVGVRRLGLVRRHASPFCTNIVWSRVDLS